MDDPIASIRAHRDCEEAISILSNQMEEGNKMTQKEAIVKYLRGRHLIGFANVLSCKTQENITTWLWQNGLA
jgi:hypothetical protein